MAKLTGKEIIRQVELGTIVIEPFDPAQINPNSYNVRLGNKFVLLDESRLDLHKKPKELHYSVGDEGVCLCKGGVLLGHTLERLGSTKFVPILDGRSTIGRYGVCVHITAGYGDIGFINQWTLELEARHRDTWIRPGDLIAQVSFETVEGEIQLYSGSYANGNGPIGPKPLK